MIDSIKKYMLGVFYADSREIASLNGIRSWGIFMLFAGHLYRFMPNVDQSAGWLRNALDNTSQCLDLFFVLSGFLISGPLMRQLERTGTLDLKNFYTKRSLRIFPAYFIFCALQYFVFIPVMIHSDPAHADMLSEWRGRIIYDLLYVSNYIRGTIFHGWSLSLEEQFYLLFPFLLLVVFRYFGKRGRLVFLLLFTVAPLIYRGIILVTVILPSPAADHINLYNKLIYYPFHGHYDSVFIGVILAFLYQNYGSLIDRIYNDHRLFYTIQAVAALGHGHSFSGLFDLMGHGDAHKYEAGNSGESPAFFQDLQSNCEALLLRLFDSHSCYGSADPKNLWGSANRAMGSHRLFHPD